ncbi:MAG: hypothetical protein IJ129_06005 [Ruminococcus sp.]|nr:hypothetical protein [Ruminococcus sp.]
MAKICKSCGNYYKGEYCDKCGYGKKGEPSKIPDKYKKATKPERFRTDEDRKLYARWEKEKQRKKAKSKRRDPNAQKGFLAAVAVVAVGLIVFAMYKSGIFFSNTREQVIEQYFTAIESYDFDKFVKCFPKEIKNDYLDDLEKSELSKEDYMHSLYSFLKEDYGEDCKISVKIESEEHLNKSEYDMGAYYREHGTSPDFSEVYEVVVNVTFKGSKGSDEAKLYLYVAKSGTFWRICGMEEDPGMISVNG